MQNNKENPQSPSITPLPPEDYIVYADEYVNDSRFYTYTDQTYPQHTSYLDIRDDTRIMFQDGTCILGRELRTYLKVLKKIVHTEFPEELL